MVRGVRGWVRGGCEGLGGGYEGLVGGCEGLVCGVCEIGLGGGEGRGELGSYSRRWVFCRNSARARLMEHLAVDGAARLTLLTTNY